MFSTGTESQSTLNSKFGLREMHKNVKSQGLGKSE